MSETTVVIYGASDDLIEVEGSVVGCDEYDGEHASFVLIGLAGEQARVNVRYGAYWAIEVTPVDEDVPMLPCAIEGMPNGYSPRAVFSGVASVVKADV